MLSIPEAIVRFTELEEQALADMVRPPHVDSREPLHLVACHARLFRQVLETPKKEWIWSVLRASWKAISSRRSLPSVDAWLLRHEYEVLEFLVFHSPKTGIRPPTFVDRAGRVHVVQRTA